MGLVISTKFGINIWIKLIFSKSDGKSFMFWGKGIYLIPLILSGSPFTPSFETIFPRIFPSRTPNIYFFVFNDIPYLQKLSNTFLRCPK
jgi:hypothetical protein